MLNEFSVILQEFETELQSLEKLIELGQDSRNPSRVRVASINSVTLILAATFEEFVCQMARKHAEQTVSQAKMLSDLPDALLETAWRRTLDDLSKNRISGNSKKEGFVATVNAARPKFEAVCRLLEGNTKDIDQNFFATVINNERNMRSEEITKIFKACGTSKICMNFCGVENLKTYFKEENQNKINGYLNTKLEEFFKHRNIIAHSLGAQSSTGDKTLIQNLEFFRALARDLSAYLETTLVYL